MGCHFLHCCVRTCDEIAGRAQNTNAANAALAVNFLVLGIT